MIPGKLLTSQQSVRLAMLDSVDRQQAIEAIAAHLRYAAAMPGPKQAGNAPMHWYGRRMRRRSA